MNHSTGTNMKRVLIVEDNAFFLQFFRETLRSRFPSLEISEAADGEEAIQKIKALQPEAIFMDVRLPGESGLELTKKIKAHDETNQAGIGDLVRVIESRPISKEKCWRLAEILEKAK